MPANLMNLMLVLTLSFFILIFSIDKAQPFLGRAEFLNICDTYNHLAIRQGYLSQSDLNNMIAELGQKGITVTNISVPQSKLEWGSTFEFKVDAIYSQKELQTDYNKETRSYALSYDKHPTTLCEE